MASHRERAYAFIDAATSAATGCNTPRGEVGMILSGVAQAHATLELAEQQRIANMIALAQLDEGIPAANNNARKARDELASESTRDALGF